MLLASYQETDGSEKWPLACRAAPVAHGAQLRRQWAAARRACWASGAACVAIDAAHERSVVWRSGHRLRR